MVSPFNIYVRVLCFHSESSSSKPKSHQKNFGKQLPAYATSPPRAINEMKTAPSGPPTGDVSTTLNSSAKYQPHRYQQENKRMYKSVQSKIISQSQNINQVNVALASVVKLINPDKISGELVQNNDNKMNQNHKIKIGQMKKQKLNHKK